MSNFLDKNYSEFNWQPFEILFNQVDYEVDSALGRSTKVIKDSKGRSQTELTYALKTKYGLIFNIVKNLGSDFKQMKECILQDIADMFDDLSTLLDIPEFQTKMKATLESKGLQSTYKNEVISVSKKQLSANKAEIKTETKEESSEAVVKFKEEFKKTKRSGKIEGELWGEVLTLATKLAEDSALKSSPVVEH